MQHKIPVFFGASGTREAAQCDKNFDLSTQAQRLEEIYLNLL